MTPFSHRFRLSTRSGFLLGHPHYLWQSSLTREPHPRLTENYLSHSLRPENHSLQVLNLSQYVSLSQLDQVRKVEIINSDTYLVEHISKTSLPNELPSSYSQCHHNKIATDKVNLERLENYNPKARSSWSIYLSFNWG